MCNVRVAWGYFYAIRTEHHTTQYYTIHTHTTVGADVKRRDKRTSTNGKGCCGISDDNVSTILLRVAFFVLLCLLVVMAWRRVWGCVNVTRREEKIHSRNLPQYYSTLALTRLVVAQAVNCSWHAIHHRARIARDPSTAMVDSQGILKNI